LANLQELGLGRMRLAIGDDNMGAARAQELRSGETGLAAAYD